MRTFLVALCVLWLFPCALCCQERDRIRAFGIEPGVLQPGSWNAITDVKEVRVGQVTLLEGDSIRTERDIRDLPELGNEWMTPLFLAVVEAVEEAIYNSLFMAEDMTGRRGRFVPALPIRETLEIMDRHGGVDPGRKKNNTWRS